MKFLLFNVIVAAALYILIQGGDRATAFQDAVDRVGTVAAPVIGAGLEAVEEAAAGLSALKDDAVPGDRTSGRSSQLPPLDPPVAVETVSALPQVMSAPTVPSAPEAVAGQDPALAAIDDPKILARRAEVLGGAIGADTAQPQFMTPAERQQELFRLAQDMEILSIQKTAR